MCAVAAFAQHQQALGCIADLRDFLKLGEAHFSVFAKASIELPPGRVGIEIGRKKTCFFDFARVSNPKVAQGIYCGRHFDASRFHAKIFDLGDSVVSKISVRNPHAINREDIAPRICAKLDLATDHIHATD